MKIHVLLYIFWDNTEVLGTYSSKAKAVAARKKAGFDEYECHIVMKELDKVTPR